ncbi:MAG: hypothetical protein U5S82_07905 [Gammaproteobacteria bacterium]|nr:hypothetical protein [Gammaproteobacteria bacterium]
MKRWCAVGWLIAAALMVVSNAMAGTPALPSVAVATTVWGTPYDVRVVPEEAGIRVSGGIRAAAVHPGRRLAGRVRVEVLDGAGAVLAAGHGEVRRETPARHTQRGRFEVDLGPLPARAVSLRVVYRGP